MEFYNITSVFLDWNTGVFHGIIHDNIGRSFPGKLQISLYHPYIDQRKSKLQGHFVQKKIDQHI
jgi:hypothetical protein